MKASVLRSGIALLLVGAALDAVATSALAQATDAPPAAKAEAAPSKAAGRTLLDGFRDPGPEARPRVWWHWMNGNITWEGAKADMDWMKRIGIAGLQAFDAGFATPQVVEKRLPYMSPEWKGVFRQTAAYADQLGLELATAASPGWSLTGGPWVTPQDAMKKLVWSVNRVRGGAPFTGQLIAPPRTTGVFQTSIEGGVLGGRKAGETPPELYADARVIAFRTPAALPEPRVTSSGGQLDAAALSDGDLVKPAVMLPAAPRPGGESWIQFDYGRAVTVRGVSLSTPISATFYDGLQPNLRNGLPPVAFRLDASEDGRSWRDTGARLMTGRAQRTSSVPSVRARYFRFVSITQPPAPARPPVRFMAPQQPPPEAIAIRELTLTADNSIDSFEEKAGFYNNTRYYDLPSGTRDPKASARSADVIDLTDQMSPDGTLRWTPPRGDWVVLRMGNSLVGTFNHPASPEATGLEVDKLDPGAVTRYLRHYIGMYRDASGGLIGKRGLRALMFDSWEAGNSNWTPGVVDAFKRLRGYDPTPWLPTLAGFQIDSPEKSDAFLWDWRRTIQQMVKENHYELASKLVREAGMFRYGEAHEELFVTVGDGMEMKASADVPMGAMWHVVTRDRIEKVYWNDLQESASVAHIYGQNIAAAEAMTGGYPFGSSPFDLKPTADAILLAGVNRFVIHTSTHQPISKGPGMTLGVGQYFTRNETWAEQAKPWVDYLSRASYLLQQGKAANDVAVFYGESAPVIAQYRETEPAVPLGYRYDYVNADVILNRLDIDGHDLTTQTGMRYKLLFFGRGTERVSLPVLRRTLELVQGGATLVGVRPAGSPSLADDPAEVKRILDTLWPGGTQAQVGKGRVIAAAEAGVALDSIGLTPDFSYEKPAADSNVMFIRRKLDQGDLYFLANRADRADTIQASFRTAGGVPELWDPASGKATPAAYRVEAGRTVVTVPLDRLGSVFVVFRGAGAAERQLPPIVETQAAVLTGPWQVRFQPDRGAPASATFNKLIDFRDSAESGIRYFSGTAAYMHKLDVPAAWRQAGRLWLDLGEVRDVAELWVNGKLAGTVWKPPYRVDITDFVRSGRNDIEVRATNLWVNRLIGDVQPGVTKKITFTAADGKTASGASSPQMDRIQRMPYPADAPLRPSGLLGPVTLVKRNE